MEINLTLLAIFLHPFIFALTVQTQINQVEMQFSLELRWNCLWQWLNLIACRPVGCLTPHNHYFVKALVAFLASTAHLHTSFSSSFPSCSCLCVCVCASIYPSLFHLYLRIFALNFNYFNNCTSYTNRRNCHKAVHCCLHVKLLGSRKLPARLCINTVHWDQTACSNKYRRQAKRTNRIRYEL